MLTQTALFASVVVAIIGALLLWSNPRRDVNRVVFSCSLHLAGWLGFFYLALTMHPRGLWLKWACAIAAWIPMHFWVVEKTLAKDPGSAPLSWLRRGWGWVFASGFFSIICFTGAFIPWSNTAIHHDYGWGYYAYIIGTFGLYGYVLFHGFRMLERLTGGRRLEMQVWVIGGCAMTSSIVVTMALNSITGNRLYLHLQPLLVLVFYAGTAFAITTNRIFDASQILKVGTHRLTLVVLMAGTGYVSYLAVAPFLPLPVTFLVIAIAAFALLSVVSGRLDRAFQFYSQDSAVRKAAFDVAQHESSPERLEASFLEVLKGWGQAEHAFLQVSGKEQSDNVESAKSKEGAAIDALRRARWATPEQLAREKTTPQTEVLGHFLDEHHLGVVILSESSSLSVMIGVGVPASRRPFTYPQVMQLTELASIIDNAFERAQLSFKVQHTEQLATVGLLGAGVAHEIRNPLVSIKAIVQMLPTRYHEAAFREKFFHLIGDEVARIDRLTGQLLDLASPHTYSARMMDLHPVLAAGLELVGPRATEKRVKLISALEASPDQIYTDPSAVKQTLLNLCFNAIQALDSRPGERWVKIATRRLANAVELTVSDNGPGISPEMRARLFQPFQTTKSSGFGLGLTICRDILAGLNATISVSPPAPDQGATFRVTFPCQPSLS